MIEDSIGIRDFTVAVLVDEYSVKRIAVCVIDLFIDIETESGFPYLVNLDFVSGSC